MEAYTNLKEKRINLRQAIPLDKPFTLLFDPASVCNFKCVQCFRSVPGIERWIKPGLMDFEKFKAVIDGLRIWEGPPIKVIRIIGFGEPFLNPHTPDMIAYLKDTGVAERVEITSNASLLTPEISKKLIRAGLDYLRVSIYAITQEKHERITGSRIQIQTIYDNLRTLRALRDEAGLERPFLYVKMLDTFQPEENKAFLERYTSVADEVAIEQPHNWLDLADKNFIEDLYGQQGVPQPDKSALKKVCPQPFKMLSIRQNGDVIVCDPDWMGNTIVGNAFEQSLRSIWHSQRLKDFWLMQLEGRRCENESCRRCTTFLSDQYTLDNLDGVCPAQIASFQVLQPEEIQT